MSGPHDRFIRYVLEHSERAAALLRIVLPPGLAARVRWSTLRGHPTDLVDSSIRESRGDLSFSVRLRGSSRRAFILLEHQSRVERRMAARMRRYVSRLLDRWERQHRRGMHLPLILPVVLYHGPQGPWTAPRSVEELSAGSTGPCTPTASPTCWTSLRGVGLRIESSQALRGGLALGTHTRSLPAGPERAQRIRVGPGRTGRILVRRSRVHLGGRALLMHRATP
ncbi:Rpn family recombination-promoting nuclease/putative transposase [Archangium sp.]|uniref:Rpn family recombination-promoting nuclease/putative transposase n=1 Tax=Archangium sp. TaxID=1872627 RepID=UPI002D6FB75F|nr:Rpn family recombination-promoting nuclease/putative transposase [Archangium sp.]HYO58199.1 Rpn family recombination-promoting nuclease/putative transposase [Archangium sp.]